MIMTVKKLKELLDQYPDETLIYIYDNNYINNKRNIDSVTIEYVSGDDYQMPEIMLG